MTKRGETRGIQQPAVPVLLFAGDLRGLLYRAGAAEKRRPADSEPRLLFVGGDPLLPGDDRGHPRQLLRGTGHRPVEAEPRAQPRRPAPVARFQHRVARLLQVQQFPDRQLEHADGDGGALYRSGQDPPARHQLLHLPDHDLYGRRLRGQGGDRTQHHQFRHLRRPFPAADRRPDRQVLRYQPRAAQP